MNTPTVRYLDLARAAGSAEGVAALTSLTINGTEGDVLLAGPAPLPAPVGTDPGDTTIGGTVA